MNHKNKQEEFISQQAAFKHETETHVNSWAQVVTTVEEVVQANFMEEWTRRA
jgi:hypothetical protein